MAKDDDTLKDEVFELASSLRSMRLCAWALDEELDDLGKKHPEYHRIHQQMHNLHARIAATESLVAAIPAQTFKDAAVHVMMAYSRIRVIEESEKASCKELFDDTKRMLSSALRVIMEYTRTDLTACDFEQHAPPELLPPKPLKR